MRGGDPLITKLSPQPAHSEHYGQQTQVHSQPTAELGITETAIVGVYG